MRSHYKASLGAGTVAGRFVGGANFTKVVGRATWIAGDDLIHFVLPTDIFDASHYVVAQGVGVMTTLRNTGVLAFAGATSTEFDSPLFEGARAENPAFILFLDRRLTPVFSISSKMIFSTQITAIEGLDWAPADRLKIGFSGGVGANQPYGAASLDFRRKWITVQAAYIEAGDQFHRAVVEAPLLSEPDRENAVITLKPARFFSISAGRQNFLTPVSDSQNNVSPQLHRPGHCQLRCCRSRLWILVLPLYVSRQLEQFHRLYRGQGLYQTHPCHGQLSRKPAQRRRENTLLHR